MEEVVISEANRGDNRLPTFSQKRIQSEVRVPGGQRELEGQHSRGRIKGRQRLRSREPSFLGEARKKRRIEELEEELKLLKEGNKEKDEQRHRRRRSRSHSGSCGSSHHVPSRKVLSRKSDHNHRRTVPPRRHRRSHSKTPPPQHKHNQIWRKLQQISLSPFSAKIERAKFPTKFTSPNLAVYDGKSDPVGHLSRYHQAMAPHLSNGALMCHIFPSSLGEVGLRWLDRLEHGSIRSWKEMSQVFTARFITNTRKPKEIDSLLALTMKAGETLKSYSTRYWEVYNDINACDEDIVVKTFQFSLHEDSKLRKSFTKRPPISMAKLISRLEQHIRVEDDPKSSAKIVEVAPLVDRKAALPEPQPESRRAKKAKSSTGIARTGVCLAVYTTFKEPIYQLLSLIKDKPYFEWPPKMPGDPATRETKPATAKASTPIGIIDVIHYGGTYHDQRREMRRAAHLRELPHSDALVVTLRIREFDVKRILIDPGSSVEIMYESLFKGLGLEKKDLSHAEGPLSGFSGETVVPSGKVMINVRAGTVSSPTEFFILNAFSPYNAILGRPWLHRMGAVPSTLHQRLRFPTPQGIMEIMGDQLAAKQCLSREDREEHHPQEKCVEKLVPVSMAEGESQRQFLIGDFLSGEHKSQLMAVLNEYQDVFAWTPYEAPGVDSEFVCHKLNVSPEYKPVIQKARRTAPQHAEAVREEVERLLKIGAVREVLYPQWLSNTVVVKKKNGKWRVCVDFTDLNKACPKDLFPLPKIDQLVDSTAGHERMSFLDAFQGVTYQRIVTKMFSGLLGKTVEVYIDDMVVKSIKGTDHVEDLKQVFSILRRHNLKLNASKCAFGVGSGKFLGFMVTQRGIEANPDQIAAIQGLQPPKNVREVQRLTGSDKAVSTAIVRDESGEQRSVYYISKTMSEAETRYLLLEKSALALFVTAKKLPHYFQAHTMIVLTSLPLKALFRSSDFNGRISKWGAQLGAYDVRYKPRTAIKGQVLADFIAEFALENDIFTGEEHPKDTERNLEKKGWALYVDGTANSRGSGLGVVLISPEGELLEQAVRLGFGALNNEAEYEALLHGLRVAKRLGADPLTIHYDSQVIANQLTGEYMAKDERMVAYLDLAKNLLKGFHEFNIERKEAAKIHKIAMRYWISREGKLYKKSYTGPYLLCVHPDLVPNLLYEIHEGVCGGHTGGRSLAHRAIGQGYWWPYMQKDAAQYVRRCEKCQLFTPAIHKPASQLNSISSPWPFAQWGLDLVGPLPRAIGNRQWLIVATDYFTKWVEAEPLARITDSESRKFVWKSIITRFGIPKCLISDNGIQFDSGPFKKYCSDFGIRNHFSSLAYPQGNGQAESSNKIILNGIKKRLERSQGKMAVIPLEVGLPTLRSEEYDQENNELMLAKDLDLAQERRDLAMIRLASYQGDLKKRYGKSVSEWILAPEDLVLQKVLGSRKDPTQGRLGAIWEGPYQIVSDARLGAFNLKGMDDKPLKRPWNVSNLKKFYQTFVICGAEIWINQSVIKILATPSIKILATSRSSACKSPSGLVERYQKTLAMLGVSPINPQMVWRNGIKILATPKSSACKSPSGLVERYQKTLAMLGVSPVNPQMVWRNGIKILATSRSSACKSPSGLVERYQKTLAMLGVSLVNPQMVWRNGIKILTTSKSSAGESLSGAEERQYNLAVPSI
uniref:RNA-directed DNA polymerase n=1 Tax=Fagus sylvatica TaxID=28930 RepID=A0A2N9G212_FAGSY